MKKRIPVTESLQAQLKYNCRNRCAICAMMNNDFSEKQGQIAHIDHNPSNSNNYDNLVWLCLAHHDRYDSRTSQSKNYTPQEVFMYKTQLEAYYSNPKNNELVSFLTYIMKLLNDSDGYMIYSEAIRKIEFFIAESEYPEKYNLLKWKEDLFFIKSILKDIVAIFSPINYHKVSGGYKIIFNIGKSSDVLLEKNKKEYARLLDDLNESYRKFINLTVVL